MFFVVEVHVKMVRFFVFRCIIRRFFNSIVQRSVGAYPSLLSLSLIDFRMRKSEETNSEEKPCVRVGVWVGRGAGEGVLGRQASASGPARRSGGALVRES